MILLRAPEERADLFWQMFHASADAMTLSELESGRFIGVNEVFADIVGYSPDEMVGRTVEELGLWVNPADRVPIVDAIRTGDGMQSGVLPIRSRSGELRWVAASAQMLVVDGVEALYTISHDVSEQRRLEQALRDSERLHRTVIDAMAEGVVVQNPAGQIIACNRSAEQILGLSADQMLGRTALDSRWRAIRPGGSEWAQAEHPAAETLRTGRAVTGAVMGVYSGRRSLRWLSVTTRPLHDAEQDIPAGVVVSFADITDQIATEHALADSEEQRRKVTGEMLRVEAEERARIAMDLHDDTIQVLAATLVSLDRLASAIDRGDVAAGRDAAAVARSTLATALERARRLMFELRPPLLEASGLGAAITALVDQAAMDTGWSVEVEVDLPRYSPATEALVYRTVQEVVTNARKHAQASQVSVTLSERDGVVRAEVVDNGRGFELDAALDRDRMRLHLGLEALFERVRLSGGELEVRTAPGKGTAVSFRAPVYPGVA